MKLRWGTGKKFIVIMAAFLNACAMGYLTGCSDSSFLYIGTEKYGCNLLCIATFAIDIIIVNRFLDKKIFEDRGRLLLSAVIGVLISISAVFGTYMIYGSNQIFDASRNAVVSILVILGLSLFTVPMISELTGFINLCSVSTQSNIESADKKEKNFPCPGRRILYYFIVWAIIFVSFVPMFLYVWPVNFAYDAKYQVENYMFDTISTHHPILHTLLLGWAYNCGLKHGNVNWGMQIYSLIQMLLLSAGFAFFAEYLYERGVRRIVRIIIIMLFALNPVNSYFAVTTAKEPLCAAFVMIGLVMLIRYFDSDQPTETGNKRKVTIYKILCLTVFAFSFVLASLFRNNMIYAVVVGGVIIAVFRKGWKRKLIFILVTGCILGGYKITEKSLMRATGAAEVDNMRETMSLPLNAMARAVIYDSDRLNDEIISEVYSYIPENSFENYNCFLADGVKNTANEELLKSNTANFLKLFIKIGLKCPGSYIESIVGTTIGYWYPMDFPYWISGTTAINCMSLDGDLPDIKQDNKLPFGSFIFDYMFDDQYSRLDIPIFGWLWRGTLYTWIFLYAFGFFIYKKEWNRFCILMIPFMYLGTCFMGPTSFLRYLYVNIAVTPVIIMLLVWNRNKREDQPVTVEEK